MSVSRGDFPEPESGDGGATMVLLGVLPDGRIISLSIAISVTISTLSPTGGTAGDSLLSFTMAGSLGDPSWGAGGDGEEREDLTLSVSIPSSIAVPLSLPSEAGELPRSCVFSVSGNDGKIPLSYFVVGEGVCPSASVGNLFPNGRLIWPAWPILVLVEAFSGLAMAC